MARLSEDGFTIVRSVLSQERRTDLSLKSESVERVGPGTRCLLSHAWCRKLAAEARESRELRSLIPQHYVAIQCTYFEKSTESNWLVPVHQDLSVPVGEISSLPGWGPWSKKEGITFVQPSTEVLESLLAVRLHLDPCGPDDGPLFVIPGTHRNGVVHQDAAVALRSRELACVMEAGDALVFHPLLLHRSSKATGTSRRRVLHLLLAPPVPSLGLEWHSAA